MSQQRSVIRVFCACLLGLACLASHPTPAAAQEPFEPSEDRGKRVAMEALGGLAGTAVGVVGGALLGCGTQAGFFKLDAKMVCVEGAMYGAGAGAVLGGGFGTYVAGNGQGGNGKYLATAGGHLWGMALGLGTVVLLHKLVDADDDETPDVRDVLIIVGLGLVGGVLGYELS